MPNTVPPIVTCAQALQYRNELIKGVCLVARDLLRVHFFAWLPKCLLIRPRVCIPLVLLIACYCSIAKAVWQQMNIGFTGLAGRLSHDFVSQPRR